MPSTGPFHGKEGVVYSGANQIGKATEWSYRESAPVVDGTAGGDTAGVQFPGVPVAEGACTFRWNPADTNGQAALSVGDEITLILYPKGNSSGETKLEGTVKITEIERLWSYNDVPTYRFSFVDSLTEGSVT